MLYGAARERMLLRRVKVTKAALAGSALLHMTDPKSDIAACPRCAMCGHSISSSAQARAGSFGRTTVSSSGSMFPMPIAAHYRSLLRNLVYQAFMD